MKGEKRVRMEIGDAIPVVRRNSHALPGRNGAIVYYPARRRPGRPARLPVPHSTLGEANPVRPAPQAEGPASSHPA